MCPPKNVEKNKPIKPTLQVFSAEDAAAATDCTDPPVRASGAADAARAADSPCFTCKAVIEDGGTSLVELMDVPGQAPIDVDELNIGCQSSSMYGEGLRSDATASSESSSSALRGLRQVLAFSRYRISFALIASRPLIQTLIPPSSCPGVLSHTS